MINEEISNQMTRTFIEIKSSLNFQKQSAISAAITETVLPSKQHSLDMHGRSNYATVDRWSNGLHQCPRTTDFTVEDRRSSELQRNPESENAQRT